MASASEIKKLLDNELKPDKMGKTFEEINEKAIKIFQRLFVEYLNYDLVKSEFDPLGEDILCNEWNTAAEAEEAHLIAEKDEFRVMYIVIKKLTQGRERFSISSVKRLKWAKKREYICIFYARESLVWDIVCPHIDKDKIILRRFILGDGENHRTVSENLSLVDASDSKPLFDRVQDAFKVQPVTDAFFEDYKKSFFLLKEELAIQGISKKEAHEFTLQLLNRIMFIYFISKKEGWLNTKNFIGWLWDTYNKEGKKGSNDFYKVWLKQIFFKAFNNRANDIKGLPKGVIDAVNNFPFLNGGLFNLDELDELNVKIDDDLFFKIFDFFEDYNFTIREDLHFDVEVAVDPQMIGYVYESLANVAEEIYDRHDLGIFYTPRIEVDFMARRSLIEWLSKKLPKVNKEHLYYLIFDTNEAKEDITQYFKDEKFWYELEGILDDLSVVDPACGSGAFLVGMLNVLTELFKLIYKNIKIKRDITDFGLKKRIIQYSLYGVDIMRWAIHAADLRLWLQLMVETELKKEELRKYPLLPNLDLNLRIGDSLVQEIGGVFFNLRTNEIDEESKRRLQKLKQEKRNYFDNSPGARFGTSDEIYQEEIRIFEGIVEKRSQDLLNEIKLIKLEIRKEKGKKDLFNKPAYNKAIIDQFQSDIKELEKELKYLKEIIDKIKNPAKKPFIWDIDFAEIFGEKNGFDIVIGNPPYVRQEDIAPFDKLKSEITNKEKAEYKKKLIKSVQNQFPQIKQIDGKSDYYIYFYFHGLSLLNENGTFCFITSNSWLDLKFGRNLQEFLLKYVPIHAIYDYPIRSFEHASINTIITVFGSPKLKEKRIAGLKIDRGTNWPMLNQTAKFIMLKKSFEDAINVDCLISIEKSKVNNSGEKLIDLVINILETEEFRVFPILHTDLLSDGWKYPKSYDFSKGKFKKGKYDGNKWGGKFLKAPEVFYTILKKGKDKFIKLKEIANVRRGFTTGANKFFYLNRNDVEKWNIEPEYLMTVIKSAKDSKELLIDKSKLKTKLFYCQKNREELNGTNALRYIEYGEDQGFNDVISVQGRQNWWEIKCREPADAIILRRIGKRMPVFEANGVLEDCVLFGIIRKTNEISKELLLAILNSTWTRMYIELMTRELTGAQTVADTNVYTVEDSLVFNPALFEEKKEEIIKIFDILKNRESQSIFIECGIDPDRPIREQEPNLLDDRKVLDDIFFDDLGLNEDEKKEFYWAMCEIVKARITKSESV